MASINVALLPFFEELYNRRTLLGNTLLDPSDN